MNLSEKSSAANLRIKMLQRFILAVSGLVFIYISVPLCSPQGQATTRHKSSDYFTVLEKQIRRAWFPPSAWRDYYIMDSVTIRLTVESSGRIDRLRFAERAQHDECNQSAYHAVLGGLYNKIDYKSCINDDKSHLPIELEVLFLHKDSTDPASVRKYPIVLRRIDKPEDLAAQDWFFPDRPNTITPDFFK